MLICAAKFSIAEQPVTELRFRISVVAENGMTRGIGKRRAQWNFGAGSLWTHQGWQYAAFWDEGFRVSVARRRLPDRPWQVFSLGDYQRTATIDRGQGGSLSQGFGDGHEKVSMGISPDGHIHLSFDHHLSRLRYRVTKEPVAANPERHAWTPNIFGPRRDELGGLRHYRGVDSYRYRLPKRRFHRGRSSR